MEPNQNAKSFWKKPEGITGLLFLAAALCGAYYILPFLITLLANALYAGIMLACFAAMLYILFDPKFRTLISYMYKTAMRKITGAFIELNPIAILRVYIDDMAKNLQEFSKQIGNLRAQMVQLKQVIDKNAADHQLNMKKADLASRSGEKMQVALMSRKAGRLKESNMTLTNLYTKLEIMYRALTKMYEVTEVVLEDTKDEVDVKEREQKAVSAGASAIRSAKRILAGNPDQKFMFDHAMEALVDDTAAKVGEMEEFMRVSSKVIASVDLTNGVYEEEAFAELEKWQQNGESILLGDQKTILINKAQDKHDVLDLAARPVAASNTKSNYNDLFGLEDRQ